MEFKAYPYQAFAVRHIIDNSAAGLFLDMGLGKTVSTLTAIDRLMYDYFEVNKVLVIAPKRVAEDTWTTEAAKWDHLKHLRISVVLGSERERKEALKAEADIYVINRENVAWLIGYYQFAFPFDMLVIDELSSFKSPKAVRFKALKMVRPKINRVVGLTGTPAPNGFIDLWSQLYLLDMGERLGKTVTGYREKYFTPGRTNGQIVFDYKLRADSEKTISSRISDICISMKAEDYLDLPRRMDRVVTVRLSPETRKKYENFEREQILAIEGEEVSAVNAAALSGKLLQFANGAVYGTEKNYHEIHMAKIEALKELIEAANGQPVLVFYSFRSDCDRITKHLADYKPQMLKTAADIRKWNNGEIPLLLAHPASAGHGLNLQEGGNTIVWFGLTWSLELYQQANARLHRQGQIKPVMVYHLVAEKTMDGDVMESLAKKTGSQEALMNAVKARVKKYKEIKNF